MSGRRENSEQKANDVNFFILSSQPIRGLNFGLSTNGKPLFQVLQFWLTSKIRLLSQQLDCNLSNHTAILLHCCLIVKIAVQLWRLQSDWWDCSLIAEIAVWYWRWVKIGGPEIGASHWLRAQNQGLWLVERTGFKKFKALAFRSEISLIPLIPDGNLYNQTAICIIRLQSPQFDSNLYNQTAISRNRLQKFSNLHIQSVNPTASQSGWVPHLSAFSTIRL